MVKRKYRSAWHYWLGELGVCWIGGDWKPLKGFCRWWRQRRDRRARLRSMWRNTRLTTAQKVEIEAKWRAEENQQKVDGGGRTPKSGVGT